MTGLAPHASFRRMRRDNRGPAISPWAKDALAGVALAIFVGALIFLQFVSGAAH